MNTHVLILARNFCELMKSLLLSEGSENLHGEDGFPMEKPPSRKSVGDQHSGNYRTLRLLSRVTGAQRIQIISPCLHHVAALSNVLRTVVHGSYPICI